MVVERDRYERSQRSKPELGFTLIELLIVIVVLGILAAVVVFALGGVTAKGVVSSCNADAKTVQTAVASYQAQNATAPAVIGTSGTGDGYLVPTYLQSWPQNTGSNYAISVVATTGQVQVTVASTSTPWSGGVFTPGSGAAANYSATACSTAST
jgi:general secretion pathway protein G